MRRIDGEALTHLKTVFEGAWPGFVRFGDAVAYDCQEDNYRRACLNEAEGILENNSDRIAFGTKLLNVLTKRSGNFGLIGLHMAKELEQTRNSNPELFEEEAVKLAHDRNVTASVMGFVDATWPILSAGVEGRLRYRHSRAIPTMLAALLRPHDMISIQEPHISHAANALFGETPLFGHGHLKLEELERVLDMARQIFKVMTDDWGWEPRDLWDVYSFIRVTCRKKCPNIPARKSQEKIANEHSDSFIGPLMGLSPRCTCGHTDPKQTTILHHDHLYDFAKEEIRSQCEMLKVTAKITNDKAENCFQTTWAEMIKHLEKITKIRPDFILPARWICNHCNEQDSALKVKLKSNKKIQNWNVVNEKHFSLSAADLKHLYNVKMESSSGKAQKKVAMRSAAEHLVEERIFWVRLAKLYIADWAKVNIKDCSSSDHLGHLAA